METVKEQIMECTRAANFDAASEILFADFKVSHLKSQVSHLKSKL